MRKLRLQVQVSVDGFIAGTNGELDWAATEWSKDIENYVDEITKPVAIILLGRNLAMGFIPHWTSVAQDKSHPAHEAGIIFDRLPKIVFSKTLMESNWENTVIDNGVLAERVSALKTQPGGDLIAYGGGQCVSSLIKEKLVDEFYLFINPVILGKGMPIFREIDAMQQVKLITAKQFECGIIVLVYSYAH